MELFGHPPGTLGELLASAFLFLVEPPLPVLRALSCGLSPQAPAHEHIIKQLLRLRYVSIIMPSICMIHGAETFVQRNKRFKAFQAAEQAFQSKSKVLRRRRRTSWNNVMLHAARRRPSVHIEHMISQHPHIPNPQQHARSIYYITITPLCKMEWWSGHKWPIRLSYNNDCDFLVWLYVFHSYLVVAPRFLCLRRYQVCSITRSCVELLVL